VIWNPAFSQRVLLVAAKAGFQIAHSASLHFAFGMTEILSVIPTKQETPSALSRFQQIAAFVHKRPVLPLHRTVVPGEDMAQIFEIGFQV
jgi:hypothetical protein